MNKLSFIFIIAVLLSVTTSCDDDEVRILSKGKMEKVLYDYHLAQGMMNMNDPEGGKLIDAVFAKHGITEEEFDSSLVYYNIYHKDLLDIYTNLSERLEKEEKDLRLQSGSNEMTALMTDSRDTTNIWNGSSLIVLRPNEALNKKTFTIKADTSFYKGDRFILTVGDDFIRQHQDDREACIVASISLRYEDDFTIADTRQIYSPGIQQLSVNADTQRKIKQVSGFFYYQTQDKTRSLALIRDVRLVRIHTMNPDETDADTLVTDSLQADSILTDSVKAETLKADSVKNLRHNTKRMTPEELRINSSTEKAKIITAPKIRTRNSIGPRRRKPARK